MITNEFDTDEFDIDDEELFRLAKIEEECGCEVIAGIDHGRNLGNYLLQTLNSISYDELKEILAESKVGNILSSEEIDEVVSSIEQRIQSSRIEPSRYPIPQSA
jgi:hypothetical protein